MTGVLVVNAGSSSLKYAVVDPASGHQSLSGIVERIGESESLVRHAATDTAAAVNRQTVVGDHRAAFAEVQQRLTAVGASQPDVVGHRVVHGGDRFTAPAVIDDEVVAAIEECVPLAPLHNPPALAGIAAARQEFPAVPQVAVFDTAFHATIPVAAHRYAIDPAVAREHRLRRYGFHGTSHEYVAHRAARLLDQPIAALNLVTLHLGNGASACAVRGGVSVETSMGVTPLEGLVMGTRSGDVDPAIPFILARAGMSADDVDALLNRDSGLKGVCGDNDMREIHRRAAAGDADAALAREMFAHRVRKYLGAYMATLGRTDAVVFTAGIGEHDSWTRQRVCEGLEPLGIRLDDTANTGPGTGSRVVSTRDSSVTVLVVRTDEEHAIAEQAWQVVAS
jgi:acetate kinase